MPETLDDAVLAELRDDRRRRPEFVVELVDTYLAEAPGYLAAIDGRARGRRRRGDRRPAHTLKSNSATLGAMRLAEIARELEERARAGRSTAPATRPRRHAPSSTGPWPRWRPLARARRRRMSELAERPLEPGAAPARPHPGRRRQPPQPPDCCRAPRHPRARGRRGGGRPRSRSTCWARRRRDRRRPARPRDARDGRLRDPRGDQGRPRPCAHLPVIMISGVDELDSVVRCIEMGAADYLPKPFNPVILPARVATSLADKRLRDRQSARPTCATIERQRRSCRRFLSPQVAALVSSAEGEQLLAGHRREVTSRLLRPARLHRLQRDAPSRRSCSASCASTTRRWAR